jgi:8-oxo-dGTP diphosphatase
MNTLRIITDQDVGLEPKPFDLRRERFAARAVMRMGEKVALMHITNGNYFKLPGGGIERAEDGTDALNRELLEETGCRAKIIKAIGRILEERGEDGFRQVSEAYIVEQYGDIVEPELTEREKNAGAEVFWADDIDHAIELVESSAPDTGGSKFMRERDGTFLREAKKLLSGRDAA